MKYLLLVCVDEQLAASDHETERDPNAWIAAAGPHRLEGHQLRGPADATLVRDSGGLVTDGPFAETKELIAGFWLIQVDSKEEAIEWARRCPNPLGEGKEAEIEIRQIYEMSDFPADIFPPEEVAREQALRAATAGTSATSAATTAQR
ncbi:MAG: YciI family protein [Gammaproteobacteria bacterium]